MTADLGLLDGIRTGTWLDAQRFPPLEWSVDGIVPEGFGLLVAPPKAGKSWMVAGVGLACAAGGSALGKIAVSKRPVLYLALEDGHRRLQSRFRTLMEGQPIPAGIEVITKAQSFEVPAMIEEWLALHPGEKPLIILDTLGKVKSPKRSGEDSYAADYAIGGKLKDLIDAVPGATLLVVHHTRKAESEDFVDAVSGTQGIAGSADFILVLRRKRQSAEAVLSVTGRDVPENEYALTTEGGLWLLDGADLTVAAEAVKTRKNTENLGDRSVDVLAYVTRNPDGVTPAQTDAALGITDSKVYLSRLLKKGSIDRPVRGIYTAVTSPSAVTSVTSVTNPGEDDEVTQVTEVTPTDEVTAPLWDEPTKPPKWTWTEPGRGQPGVGRAIITVSLQDTDWLNPQGTAKACNSVLERKIAHQSQCTGTVSWKVSRRKDHTGDTSYWCDADLPDEYRPLGDGS